MRCIQSHVREFRGAAFLMAVASAGSPVAAQQTAAAVTSLVFDGVTVVDVEQGKLVPDQCVVIVGNRIKVVGDMGAVTIPKRAQVVYARGKYLMPGLWDMHVHNATDFAYPLFITNGVTGMRDAHSFIPLDTMVQWRQEILAGTRIGPPRQLLSGHVLGPSDSAWVAYQMDSLKTHGANFLKVYPMSFVVAAAARRAGLPFGGHVGKPVGVGRAQVGRAKHPLDPDAITAAEASDSGISLIDHLNTSGGLDTLCLGYLGSVARCQAVAEHLRQNNTWFVPTLGVYAEDENAAGYFLTLPAQRVFVHSLEFLRAFWAGAPFRAPWLLESDPDHGDAPLSEPPDSLMALDLMQQAGLPIVAGTDITISSGELTTRPPGFALQAELAMMVAEGLTRVNVLQAATLNPAKMLRATDSLGTVAPGKLADLVLLDADPLADITNTTRIRAVVANGRYFDRAALDAMLTQLRSTATRRGFRYWGPTSFDEPDPLQTGGTP